MQELTHPALCSVRKMAGHRQRVGAIAWGASALSTGSRDRTILQRDVRSPQSYHAKLSGHRSEVRTPGPGLWWSSVRRASPPACPGPSA